MTATCNRCRSPFHSTESHANGGPPETRQEPSAIAAPSKTVPTAPLSGLRPAVATTPDGTKPPANVFERLTGGKPTVRDAPTPPPVQAPTPSSSPSVNEQRRGAKEERHRAEEEHRRAQEQLRRAKEERSRRVLRLAADLVAKGWTQGAAARTIDGTAVRAVDPEAVRWGIGGSIRAASQTVPMVMRRNRRQHVEWRLQDRARIAIGVPIGATPESVKGGSRPLDIWNDSLPTETGAEIVRASLLAAAESPSLMEDKRPDPYWSMPKPKEGAV